MSSLIYFFIMIKLIILLFNVFNLNLYSNNPDWTDIDKKTKDVLYYIANEEFEKVEKNIKKLEQEYKENKIPIPIHHCLNIAYYFKIIEDYKTRELEKDFKAEVKESISKIENIISKEENKLYQAKYMQYLAAAYGYRGIFRTLAGMWPNAFIDGKVGKDMLEKSSSLDPDLSLDNDAGIGTYLYWRSANAGFVKYLLFWGDKKDIGIEKIKSAIKKGKTIKLWASGGLLRIYINEKKWQEALELSELILEEVPNDIGVIQKKAYILEKLNRFSDALKVHERILEQVMSNSKYFNTDNLKVFTIYNIINISIENKIHIKEKYLKELEKINITDSFEKIKDYYNYSLKHLKK